MTADVGCPFCDLPSDDAFSSNPHTIAIPDAYPLAPGHTLIIPRIHVESVFDLPEPFLEERSHPGHQAPELAQ